jgi:outer membrane receptor protein involved in Fe transport
MPGFATKVVQGIRLTVGQYAELDIVLDVSATETEIIERQKTVQSATIEELQIDNLPINGRNYLDFTLLTPGSTDKSSLISFSAPQTPDSGLTFAGQDQRSNYVTIDGADNMDIVSGGVRSTLSQDAIQEFQISRNTFSAEFGRARGGLINIISKSGTNDFHGNVFFFFRNNKLDARNTFSKLDDPPFKRYEFGGTFGGPIVKDKTFFFANYERLDREESNFVTFLDDDSIFRPTTPEQKPDTSQTELFEFLDATGIPQLQQLAFAFINPAYGALHTTPLNFPDTLDLFESESGIFPFEADRDLFSFKLDHQFSTNNNLTARFNYGKSFNDGVKFGALQGVSNGMSFDTKDLAFVLSDTHVFSASTLNEAKFQFGRREFETKTNDPFGPEIILSGVAQFGQEFFNPTSYDEKIYQFTDNVTLIRGDHTFKMGADVNIMDLTGFAEVFLGGQFSFGEAIPLANIMDSAVGPGTSQLVKGTVTALGREDLVDNVDAPVTSVQSYNFGLPITYFQGFGDPNTAIKYYQLGMFFQDSWRVSSNFTLNLGLRYDTDWRPKTTNVLSSESTPFQFDYSSVNTRDNFGPRIGFAWDPCNNGRMVVRGGYGLYYQNFFQAVAFVSQVLSGPVAGQTTGISQVFLPVTGLPGFPATSAHVWAAYQATGRLDEDLLAQLGIAPGTTPSVILPSASNVRNPYSQHGSLGLEFSLSRDWALAFDYILNRGTSLIRSRDINVRQTGDNMFSGYPGMDLRFVQVNMIETSGKSVYHGFTTTARKRFSQDYSMMVSYTLGRAIDDTTDFITQLQPNNQRDLANERSLSAFDQRHRLAISGIWQSPLSLATADTFGGKLVADWTVSPIVTLASGRPFNLLLGFDLNNDTHEETDRAVLTGGEIAGRNTGKGPGFSDVGLRVARRFNLSREQTYFEFLFDAFNLFNNTNYSGVNNVVGSEPIDNAHVGGSRDIASNQPLGFTSAFDPRQIQFGFRLNF